MKLYQDKRAPNPRRVRIFLAEKGLDAAGLARHGLTLEQVDVEIASQQNFAEAYLAKHPLGILPTLELDDGRLLRESMAICRWFDALEPEPALFGRDAWERAVVEQWSRHAELELLVPISVAFRNLHPFWVGKVEQVPRAGELARELARSRLGWLDRELGDRPFLAGEHYTVADITALCAIDFGKPSDIRIAADQPNLTRWYQAVAGRPSAKA